MTEGSADSSHLLATAGEGSEKSGPTRQPPHCNSSTTAIIRRVTPCGLADMRGLALNGQPPPAIYRAPRPKPRRAQRSESFIPRPTGNGTIG